MTFKSGRVRLALVVVGIASIVPATAVATHVFTDIPDEAFYADPVEWAASHEITTGKSPTLFAPLDDVTRGESVTFLHRYDDNVVQPALSTLRADIEAGPSAWGMVRNTASLRGHSANVEEVLHPATGQYCVVFNEDVDSERLEAAQITGSGSGPIIGEVKNGIGGLDSCAGNTSGFTGLEVFLYDTSGDPTDARFGLEAGAANRRRVRRRGQS